MAYSMTIISADNSRRYIVRVVFNDGEAWFPCKSQRAMWAKLARFERVSG